MMKRLLELFSGIGAASVAMVGRGSIACAVDINQLAHQVYEANFNSQSLIQDVTSLTDEQFRSFQADIWWMSPPCQPFTRRGLRLDLADPRTKALLRLLNAIETIRPHGIVLENVVGFEGSQTFNRLIETLDSCGYKYDSAELCSLEFGLPNLRPRFFLVASLLRQPQLEPPNGSAKGSAKGSPLSEKGVRSLSEFLDSRTELQRWGNGLDVDASQIESYRNAINVVTSTDLSTRCFTSAYGRSFVRSGSYLQTETGFRRFSPTEQARLLGFPRTFVLPEQLSIHQLWKLLGNTVSIPCAQHVLDCLLKDVEPDSELR
jgi:site-specific DNA-cytosine methylase